MPSTQESLVHILRDKMNVSVDDITSGLSLGPEGLDLESLSITELIMHCEEMLSVRIPDSDYQLVPQMTLQELADYLDRRTGEKV
ncbi:acyl carrier protein [Krasilnikovia sp. M28-CT-15]|uniref:acyl carrier protein n=1 Tax=Krasilnikovia sp. M28-CT-15 TaxID=3373540 RepID=UPI00399D4BA3